LANEYLYGAYGHIGDSVAQSAVQAGTVVVHIGTAPVNLVRGYAGSDLVNVPVKLSNSIDAQRKLGYASDWSKFSLCESVAAHFDNAVGNIGPIYVVNVLDPAIHRKAAESTKNLTFSAGRAEFRSDTVILDTITFEGKTLDVDYAVDYSYARGSVIITSLVAASPLTGTLAASYYEVDPAAVDAEDIIGGVTAGGVYTGLGALQLLYPEQNAVASLLAAPGWSGTPSVYNAMLAAAQKLNGHWDAFVLADIPLADADDEAVDTIAAAKAWKTANGYTNERSKVFWPQAADNTGRVFHLSSLAAAEMLRTDFSHASVPMETPGNKQIPVVRQYFGADSANRGFDQQTANGLTSAGISTAVCWAGRWVLWGDHTAAYAYGADVDPRAIFDVSMRMLMHITNAFQREWGMTIDKPMTRALKDRILNREQEKLDALVSRGALIGSPRVLFLESENATTDLMNGDFRWDIPVTPTPPLKSATVYVAYSDAGFAAYFTEGAETA